MFIQSFYVPRGNFAWNAFSFLALLSFSFPQWCRSKPRLWKWGEHTPVGLHPPIDLPTSCAPSNKLVSGLFHFLLGFSQFSTSRYSSSPITCLELDEEGGNLSSHHSKVGNKPSVHYSTSHLECSRFTIQVMVTDESWFSVLSKTFQESVIKQIKEPATENKVAVCVLGRGGYWQLSPESWAC